MTRPWIKSRTSLLDDTRLLRLNERQQLRYYQLYLLAGRLNADGNFTENGQCLDETDIAIKLRINDVAQFTKDLKALKTAKLIKANGHGPFIADFATEQVDWSRKQEQDRERQDRKRHGDVTRDESVTGDKSRNGHGNVTRLDQDQTKKEKKTKKEIKKKTTTNHHPPSSSKSSKPGRDGSTSLVAGGGADERSSLDQQLEKIFKEHKSAAETARIMRPILTAAALGKEKYKNLMAKVATRILPREAKFKTLAALASVFTDETINNKPIVAAIRLEQETVPPQFMNPITWKVLPENILQAAGVKDLNDYVATNGSSKAISTKIAALRSRTS
jgi:hypothetical protein